MKDCVNQKQNLKLCSCTYAGCSRKGICCDCVSYHRGNGELPGCFFSAEAEKSYNRSIENFTSTMKSYKA